MSEFSPLPESDLNGLDPEWYAQEYPDVGLSGLSPIDHFRRYGILLGRRPNNRGSGGSAGPACAAGAPARNVLLHPLHQLVAEVEGEYEWTSLGEDPHFLLGLDSVPLGAGWYRLELCIEITRKRSVAKFYFDSGAGFNEAETMILPYLCGEMVSRLFRLPKAVRAIRFDPKEIRGSLSVTTLRFTLLDEAAAFEEVARHLAEQHPACAGQTVEAVLQEARQAEKPQGETLADHLFRLYRDTFIGQQSVFYYHEWMEQWAIDYQKWIEQVELPGLPGAEEVTRAIAALQRQPLLSVIMPVYNTDEKFLRACIDSVLAQSYPHWELCIADDASPKPHVREILQAYQARDARIRVVYREKNGHISRASNSALEIARGDYVVLLDHDDALPEHALFFMAGAIDASPDVQVLYSDEDKIDTRGRRFDPHFKSDWNPDLFYAQNYVSHLGVYRRELLARIGGFRAGVEGSQDQDLLLRCLPHVQAQQIVHVPRVLYHWRVVEGSTALAAGEKSYTTDAGVKALQDHFAQINPAVRVEAAPIPNTYRLRWPLPDEPPLVSLLIPTRDRRALTETCVRSILEKSTYTHFEILILDNGSVEDETLAFFAQIQAEDARVRVLRYDHPFNYSAINNFGVREARGEVIGLVNNDIEVISPEWLTEMVSHALRPDIGCVGAKLYYSDDTLQHAGVICSLGGVAGHSHKHFARENPGYFYRLLLPQNLSAVTAACLLVRREVFEHVGGLDEQNLHIAFNDVDFCLKVREAGYRNLWTPYAELYHHESVSRGAEDTPEKLARFLREIEFMQAKWGEGLKHDPYYNPNLTKDREDFSLGV